MTKKAKVKPQVTVGKECTMYTTDCGTDVGKEIAMSILNVLEANNVERNAILGSIAEGVIILLAALAKRLVYGENEDSLQSKHADLRSEPLGMLTKEINRLDVELHKNGKAAKRGYAHTFARTCHASGINSVQELLDFGSNNFRCLRHMGNAIIDVIARALANLYNIKVW